MTRLARNLLALLLFTFYPYTALAEIDIDPTFSFVQTNIAVRAGREANAGHSVLRQTDGKLVIAGYADVGPGTNSVNHFLVMRFLANGSRDLSFGQNGAVITAIDPVNEGINAESASKVIQQADGKLVAVGLTGGTDSHFALVRYNTDGSLDPSFGIDGVVFTDVANSGGLLDVVQLADNSLVVAGFADSHTVGSTLYTKIAIAKYTSGGNLDTSFGAGGITLTANGNVASARSLIALTGGKFIVIGRTTPTSSTAGNDTIILRYNGNGFLDTSYGIAGKAITALSGGYENVMGIQLSDLRLAVAGQVGEGSSADFLVARFLANGTLDGSFDTDGKLTIDFGLAGGFDEAKSLVEDTSGKLVVTGRTQESGSSDQQFALARINVNGALDLSFDSDGKLTTEISTGTSASGEKIDIASDIVLQPDGLMVVTGLSDTGVLDNNGNLKAQFDASVVRYNFNGSLDQNFGIGGIVVADVLLSTDDGSTALIRQADGKFVSAGATEVGNKVMYGDFGLARYNSDGSLDGGFNGTGVASTPVGFRGDSANALLLHSYGRLVAVGSSDVGTTTVNKAFAVVQYKPDGSLDTVFGAGGMVTTDFGAGEDVANAVVEVDAGRLMVVGYTGSNDFALARYNTNGFLDFGFTGDGLLTTNLSSFDRAYAAILDSNGKLVVVGTSFSPGGSRLGFAVVRYNIDGSLDISGLSTTFAFSADGHSRALAVLQQADGKLVVAGEGGNADTGKTDLMVARFNVDNSLDTGFGSGGIAVVSDVGLTSIRAVAQQTDGKIVVAAHSSSSGSGADLLLARFGTGGALDSTFGTAGIHYFGSAATGGQGVLQIGGMVYHDDASFVSGYANNDFFLTKLSEDGGPDDDSDGVPNDSDNCPAISNADQTDTDNDGLGDVCDDDDDGDGLTDVEEAALGTDPLLADTDADSVGDATDAFPLNIAASVDADGDGLPDEWNAACDASCQAASGLVLDDDPTSAACPASLCPPFNRGWRVKLLMPGVDAPP